MNIELRRAGMENLDEVTAFIHAYHRTEGVDRDAKACDGAVRALIERDDLGRVFRIVLDGQAVGYVAICFGFSIEFGGRDAFIDELYIEPGHRGRGIGGIALQRLAREAAGLGVRALHLEVARDNDRARRLYAAAGFVAREKYCLMSADIEPEF